MRPDSVAGVVLAGGQGRRFGGFKALVPFAGRSLLAHAVAALRGRGADPHRRRGQPGVDHPRRRRRGRAGRQRGLGRGHGLVVAARAVRRARRPADAAVLLLADMPGVTAECVRRVVAAASGPGALVQATYDGRRGHPVLIGRAHLAGAVETAAGDVAARTYLAAHRDHLELVECADVGDPVDIDTRADLARLDAIARLRRIALSLPETTERRSHGEPTWFVRGRTSFLTLADHHHDDRFAFWCAAPEGSAAGLVAADPARFFVPPYVGGRGWLGVRLDVDVDWDQVEALVEDAYRAVAPRRLVALLRAAGGGGRPVLVVVRAVSSFLSAAASTGRSGTASGSAITVTTSVARAAPRRRR